MYTPTLLRTGSTLLLPGGSTHFDKLLVLHVVLFREEADQSDLTLCVVTLVPTDPGVGPLGEEFWILRLIHHLLLAGIHDVGGHQFLWEKVRRVDPLFVAVVQVDRGFNPVCEILAICGQVPTDLLLDALLCMAPTWCQPKTPRGGNP